MDHSPGQRQFATLEKYREYYQGKYHLNDQQMSEYEEQQVALSARWAAPNREAIAAHCRARRIALASHDDATAAHVAESRALGSVIAEFPTTEAAARASHEHGLQVLMGAPNIVRGGSHSGNVAASTTWRRSACWIFSRPTTTPPACWMRRSAWRRTRATPTLCPRRCA